ncbi:MAG: hypothetical protein GXX86_12945 [Propionibacterium sp.]|nr:hypothetical protein [Propionibacterium sp.]
MTVPAPPQPWPPLINPDWVEKMRQKIIEIVEKIQNFIRDAIEGFRRALDALVKATLGIIQWFVDQIVRAFEWCLELIGKIGEEIAKLQDWLQGPVNVEYVGKKIQETYPAPLQQAHDSVRRDQLASNAHWSGDGAEAFFATAGRQQESIDKLKTVITELGKSMETAGHDVKWALVGLVVTVGGAAITAIAAIGVTIAFPPSAGVTGPIIAAIVAFVVAVIKTVYDQAKAISSALMKASQASGELNPGLWAGGIGGAGKKDGEAERDGTVTDGDASWSTA